MTSRGNTPSEMVRENLAITRLKNLYTEYIMKIIRYKITQRNYMPRALLEHRTGYFVLVLSSQTAYVLLWGTSCHCGGAACHCGGAACHCGICNTATNWNTLPSIPNLRRRGSWIFWELLDISRNWGIFNHLNHRKSFLLN